MRWQRPLGSASQREARQQSAHPNARRCGGVQIRSDPICTPVAAQVRDLFGPRMHVPSAPGDNGLTVGMPQLCTPRCRLLRPGRPRPVPVGSTNHRLSRVVDSSEPPPSQLRTEDDRVGPTVPVRFLPGRSGMARRATHALHQPSVRGCVSRAPQRRRCGTVHPCSSESYLSRRAGVPQGLRYGTGPISHLSRSSVRP